MTAAALGVLAIAAEAAALAALDLRARWRGRGERHIQQALDLARQGKEAA